VLTDATADLTWALILGIARRVWKLTDSRVRASGAACRRHSFSALISQVKTIGIVGAGRIGAAVAKRAAGFSMRTLYLARTAKPELERWVRSARHLTRSCANPDFVSVHVPLHPETRHMFGEAQFRKNETHGVFHQRGPRRGA